MYPQGERRGAASPRGSASGAVDWGNCEILWCRRYGGCMVMQSGTGSPSLVRLLYYLYSACARIIREDIQLTGGKFYSIYGNKSCCERESLPSNARSACRGPSTALDRIAKRRSDRPASVAILRQVRILSVVSPRYVSPGSRTLFVWTGGIAASRLLH